MSPPSPYEVGARVQGQTLARDGWTLTGTVTDVSEDGLAVTVQWDGYERPSIMGRSFWDQLRHEPEGEA